MTSLARSGRRAEGDSIDDLRARLAERQAALTERLAEIAQAKSGLEAFRIRYRREVGLLHEELEELERGIAEAELGEFAKLVDADGAQPASPPVDTQANAAPRLTSDAVRKLFRDVARTIHPDLAPDDVTRTRRHALMVEANRAYALGDEERLRAILEAWERSPEAVQGSDPDAVRQRLARRINETEEELARCATELAAMQELPLWQLKAMVEAADAGGKDLVADTVRRLKRDIVAARNRLDAMLWK